MVVIKLCISLTRVESLSVASLNYAQTFGPNACAWKQFISGFRSSAGFTVRNPLPCCATEFFFPTPVKKHRHTHAVADRKTDTHKQKPTLLMPLGPMKMSWNQDRGNLLFSHFCSNLLLFPESILQRLFNPARTWLAVSMGICSTLSWLLQRQRTQLSKAQCSQ